VGDGSMCGRDLFNLSVRPEVDVVWWPGAGGDAILRTSQSALWHCRPTQQRGREGRKEGRKDGKTNHHPHFPNVSSSS